MKIKKNKNVKIDQNTFEIRRVGRCAHTNIKYDIVDVEMALIIAISNPFDVIRFVRRKFHHDQTNHQLYR